MGLVRWMESPHPTFCSCVSLPARCELSAELFSTKIMFRFPYCLETEQINSFAHAAWNLQRLSMGVKAHGHVSAYPT